MSKCDWNALGVAFYWKILGKKDQKKASKSERCPPAGLQHRSPPAELETSAYLFLQWDASRVRFSWPIWGVPARDDELAQSFIDSAGSVSIDWNLELPALM